MATPALRAPDTGRTVVYLFFLLRTYMNLYLLYGGRIRTYHVWYGIWSRTIKSGIRRQLFLGFLVVNGRRPSSLREVLGVHIFPEIQLALPVPSHLSDHHRPPASSEHRVKNERGKQLYLPVSIGRRGEGNNRSTLLSRRRGEGREQLYYQNSLSAQKGGKRI